MSQSAEISDAYRNIIMEYYFQLGMQQKAICDRLKVNEAAVSKFISDTKELVPDYRSENVGATMAAHAAVQSKTAWPKRAGPGDSTPTRRRRRAA
jgi:predicted transcriptional regulator